MFFMMTAQFQKTTHAQLELPQEKGEQQPTVDEAGLVINISADGSIIVNNQTIALPELKQRVQTELERLPEDSPQPLKLMIRADRKADAGHLNGVVSMLREMGVGTIRIATEIPL
jgi:biopolymer transport protein ExbD